MIDSSEFRQHLQLIQTDDGSQTLLNTNIDSTYHSLHGALTETDHVFIKSGLEQILANQNDNLAILEMGFGTGLNALATAVHVTDKKVEVDYHSLEMFPVPKEIWSQYHLPDKLADQQPLLEAMHAAPWNKKVKVADNFNLYKHNVSLLDFSPEEKFNLVYFDAFEPAKQPELWTEKVFGKIFDWMLPNGILTTYCCKGDVRRAMIKVGFEVERIPGPPGKREMIRAKKPL